MKKWSLLLVFLLLVGTAAFAQEEISEKKYENVDWYQVVLIDFQQGKVGAAQAIIDKFEAAGAEAGTPGPELYWFSTGEYDAMAIWKLEDGPGDLEWQITPDDVKWWDAFVKQQGSAEEAQKLQQEFGSLVVKSTSYLSRKEK